MSRPGRCIWDCRSAAHGCRKAGRRKSGGAERKTPLPDFHPVIHGAVEELPAAVDDLRNRLGIDAALPLGLFGFSMGGTAALQAVARRVLPIRAAVAFGAPLDIGVLVEYISAQYGTEYTLMDERRSLNEQISVIRIAPATWQPAEPQSRSRAARMIPIPSARPPKGW